MTSFPGRLVKAAIRLYTFKFRRKQASVSRNIKIKNRKYNCPERFIYKVGTFRGVKVESLCPKRYNGDKIILQFHGGGAVMDMSSLFYRKVAEKYADLTGLAVYSIDYEAGRDKVHPSLLYDCFNAYKGLLESGIKPENIAAVGDSMGANLMLATCLKARDEGLPLPCALVSICGFLDNTASGQSYFVNAHKDPMYGLPFYMSKETYSVRLRRIPPYAGNTDLKDPYLSPAFGNFKDFPPVLIVCGAIEVDESDSAMLFKAASRDGVKVKYNKYPGMFHDFLYIAPFIKESKAAWKDIINFILKCFEEKDI